MVSFLDLWTLKYAIIEACYINSVRLGEIAYNVSLNKTHSMSHASGFAPAFFVMFCNTAESVIILNDFTVL